MERRLDKNTFILQTPHLEIRRRKAKSFPLHAHGYFELEIVLEGEGEQWLNGKHYTLSRGSAYLLTPADFHEVRTKDGMLAWNIAFDETLLTRDVRCLYVNLSGDKLERIDTAASLLRKEVCTDRHIQPIMEYILTSVLTIGSPDSDSSPIAKAVQYIENHFRESPTLADVAAQACLCPVYFGTLFKKEKGVTYIEYLNAKKIECAKMLLDSGMPVTEACFASGFGSLSGFLYTFKKTAGCTPREYSRMGCLTSS